MKIMKQFDVLSEQYQKSATTIAAKQPVETAGMLKRKGKKKKEKSLSSKLRLKEKKGGPKWRPIADYVLMLRYNN